MEGNKRKALFALGALVATAIGIFCYAKPTRAATSDLIITEVMYDYPESDTGHEWIEVYNAGKDTIDIGKDKLRIKINTSSYAFEDDLEINQGEFAIISNNKEVFGETDKDKIVKAKFDSLPNTTATISISYSINDSSYESQAYYSSDWGANGNGRTLEKINLTEADTEENWQESFSCQGTPGEKSSVKKTYPDKITINEILPNPEDNEEEKEFIELFNPNEVPVDLTDWSLQDMSGASFSFGSSCKPADSTGVDRSWQIDPGKYLVIYRSDFGFSLNNTRNNKEPHTETVVLRDPNGDQANIVYYNENAKEGWAYAFSQGIFQWTSTPKPDEKNIITTPVSDKKGTAESEENFSTAEDVSLSEILPNPKGSEEENEFIEIVNRENGPVDLFGWVIRDGSKTGKYVFKEHVEIKPADFLAVYRPQFKIALNNSEESVSLYNPRGELVSNASFDKSIENSSYNFDGKEWKWSKFLTPGKKNKFDSLPKVKIKKIKYAYKDLYAEFSVKAEDKETKNLKYIWNFGDGKKSTLAKTTHKYLSTGKYIVTLSVSDDSQTVEKSFSLEVKKIPRPDLEIVKIVPNPAGSDAEAETIDLKNNSNKKIDLTGWKIATGSGEKIFNHPISGELNIDPGETKTITREFSKFSLNNKSGKVQLVFPDGKVADSVEYSKEKIIEDEAYAKINGEWKWFDPNAQEEEILTEESSGKDGAGDGEVLGAMDENPLTAAQYDTHFTSEDAYIFLSQISFVRDRQEINYTPASNPSSNIAYLIASLI